MLYESSCCFSPDEPDRLQLLLAGRPLPSEEARRWQRMLLGKRRVLPIVSTLLVGLFLCDALSRLTVGDLIIGEWVWLENLAVVLLLLFTAAVVLGALISLLRLPQKEANRRYAVYAANNAPNAVITRFAFYEDRLVVRTVRGERVMLFSQVEACVETVDGFALTDGDDWIILRAQDMIHYDACLLHDYLAKRVGSPIMQVKSRAQARLVQPLPVLRIMPPEPLAQATVPYETSTVFCARRQKRRRCLAVLSASLGFLAGTAGACYVSITPWFLWDVVIGGCVLAVAAVAFSAVLFARLCANTPGRVLTVQFFPDGVSVGINGALQFYKREGLYVSATPEGMQLHFGDDETLFVPFQAADNSAAVKALAGVPNNSDEI